MHVTLLSHWMHGLFSYAMGAFLNYVGINNYQGPGLYKYIIPSSLTQDVKTMQKTADNNGAFLDSEDCTKISR